MRLQGLARRLLSRLQHKVAIARRPDFQVIREGGEVYLRRWWIIPRNKWMNVYLHHMIKSDDDVLHDHPYASLSLVLTDGLRERYRMKPHLPCYYEDDVDGMGKWDRPVYGVHENTRKLRAGQVVWRSSRMAHQILVDRPAWTLFITGPRVREWGFWCRRGFRHWQEYVGRGQNPDGSGNSGKGRGCGEMA